MKNFVESLLYSIKSLGKEKIAGLIFLFLLTITIPVVVLFGALTQQQITQHAATFGDSTDTCDDTHIHRLNVRFREVPVCSTTSNASHQTFVDVTLISDSVLPNGKQIVLDWDAATFFCGTKSSSDGWSGNGCYGNKQLISNQKCTISRDTNGTLHNGCLALALPQQAPAGKYAGLTCGHYQDDFSFNYNGSSTVGNGYCHYGSVVPVETSPGGGTYCGFDCTVTPTPTNTPTPTVPVDTPTPTTPITPSDTPTATPTLPFDTPTDTPIPSVTDTPTSGPSATPTNTPTGTLTPTVTNTPGPSSTPGPTHPPYPTSTIGPTRPIAIRPTLPATGPGNTIVGIGVAGVVLLVAGGLLFLML